MARPGAFAGIDREGPNFVVRRFRLGSGDKLERPARGGLKVAKHVRQTSNRLDGRRGKFGRLFGVEFQIRRGL